MLLGFKKQFAPKILDGSKKFTIRNPRKREPKIGEQLHMYTGLRTKFTEKITSEHTLKGIQLVEILVIRTVKRDDIKRDYSIELKTLIVVDGHPLKKEEYLPFVNADGFYSIAEFTDYWLGDKPEKSQHFQEGQKEPILSKWMVHKKDLIMYHWTDLRF